MARTLATGRTAGDRTDLSGAAGRLRSMPESIAAEAAVLGSMVIDPECIGQVVEVVGGEDFYRTPNRHIFEALVALYERNRSGAIDAVLLRNELQKRGRLEEAGGVDYLARVIDSVPSAANVMYYAGIVKDKMLLREMIRVAGGIIEDAFDQTGEVREKLDEAERRIFAVTDKNISSAAVELKDLVVDAFEMIEKRESRSVTGIATGYHRLDEITCGLQNGEMIIIAGRPSMGKTSLALNIAEYVGMVKKTPVALFSLEMGRQQLAERFLSSASQIESQRIRKGMLDTEHYKKLVHACGQLSEAPIFIDDTAALSPLELRAKARRLKSQRNAACFIVDYLQLMHMGGSRIESRQQEISAISRYLKALARELESPVVVLSQLNRAPENREDHRPRMSDLRESGSIEQDADVVMLLHREDYYHRGEQEYTDTNGAELIIAKQRNGPTGTVELVFREKYARFENAAAGMGEPLI
jgi:replicative DNA helicase